MTDPADHTNGSRTRPAQDGLADLARRISAVDLAEVHAEFLSGPGADLPRHGLRQSAGLEYRRFLLLRVAFPDEQVPPPSLIAEYWRLHAADEDKFRRDCDTILVGTSTEASDMRPGSGAPGASEHGTAGALYKSMFPTGDHTLWGADATDGVPALCAIPAVRLHEAISLETRSRLRTEAADLRKDALRFESDRTEIDHLDVVVSPTRQSTARGPLLDSVHRGPEIAALIERATGVAVVPTGAGYLYYEPGDRLGLHTDPRNCDLTLLTHLAGPRQPLLTYPELADLSREALLALAQQTRGGPDGGTGVEINEVPYLLHGRRIPHRRRPNLTDDTIIIAGQCYATLLEATRLEATPQERPVQPGCFPPTA